MRRAGFSLDIVLVVVAGAWTVFCLATLVTHIVKNPMHARYANLESRLSGISYQPEDIESPAEIDDRILRDRVMAKSALWKDLVAPPPPPPKIEKGPDLDALVKGIRPSARQQITNAQGTYVKIQTEEDPSGKMYGVGDKLKDLTILEITGDEVIFQATIARKEYSIPVKRR